MPRDLCVDLDGTLLRTDTLYELVAESMASRPIATVAAVASGLWHGRADLKRRLATLQSLDVETLPMREDLVRYLQAQRDAGRRLHLVTAADQSVAEAVAAQVGLFDTVIGSDGVNNLKGVRKLEVLHARFPDGFAYAGDSRSDLPIWRAALATIVAGRNRAVARAAASSGPRVEASFPEPGAFLRDWRAMLRVPQWSKNLLVFAPLLLAHAYDDLSALLRCALGFLLVLSATSGTYIANDLADLAADRRHPTKRNRPFASGRIPLLYGMLLGPAMILGPLIAGMLLQPAFGVALLVYCAGTLVYSFGVKRVPLLDLFVIAFLFTMRLIMGVALAHVEPSNWLNTFSMFFFFSLAAAKRYPEVTRAGSQMVRRRGYVAGDAPLVQVLGVGAGLTSLVILTLYIVNDAYGHLGYTNPAVLWAFPGLLAIWIGRIWLLSHRGELNDDPVTFALGDRTSLGLAGLVLLAFLLATA